MSVAGVGSSVDLYSVLQQLNGSTQSTDSASAIASAGTDSDGTVGSASEGQHHHHHHGISNKIESAVTDALKSAPPGSDPNQVIEGAIQKALSPNGSTTGTDSTNQQTTASVIDNGSSQSADSFSALLKSFGVDPKQFQQDFKTAVQNVSQDGGGVDFASLFQSFPPGSAVDTVG